MGFTLPMRCNECSGSGSTCGVLGGQESIKASSIGWESTGKHTLIAIVKELPTHLCVNDLITVEIPNPLDKDSTDSFEEKEQLRKIRFTAGVALKTLDVGIQNYNWHNDGKTYTLRGFVARTY